MGSTAPIRFTPLRKYEWIILNKEVDKMIDDKKDDRHDLVRKIGVAVVILMGLTLLGTYLIGGF